MAGWKLFNRKNSEMGRSRPEVPAAPQAELPEASAPAYRYCSFCGQKYPAGTKHFCSVNDLIKYDLK